MIDVDQKPMLARLVRELPSGDLLYEPKWDGFRCIAHREGDDVDLRSRHGRPLPRYFPEIGAALTAAAPPRVVLDGELLVLVDGRFDFPALMARLHPAARRVRELAGRTPAVFVAFDLLAVGSEDLRPQPFRDRRARLVELLVGAAPPLFVTPATADRAVAAGWLERFRGGGLDGVVAKPCELFDEDERLEHIGVASSFARATGVRLAHELAPLVVALEGHPWEHGFLLGGGATGRLKGAAGRWEPGMTLDWLPVAPRRVCEVAYTQIDGRRLRHPAKLVRWRPDRDPSSCRIEQLEEPLAAPGQMLGRA